MYISLLLGGFLGGCLRELVELALPSHALPTATLAINLFGSLALGILIGLSDRAAWPNWLRIGMGAGVLGSFTTFSSLCFGLTALTSQHLVRALVFTLASLVLGPTLAWAGHWMVHALQKELPEVGEELSL